jgi:RHS repeat-associated protein
MSALVVRIRRDLRGRPVAIGTAAAPGRFARYRLRPDGSPADEILGDGSLARRGERDALRRPVRIADPALTLAYGYRAGGLSTGPYGDGRITVETSAWAPSAFAGEPPVSVSRRYAFDPFGRLRSVASEARPAQDLTQVCDANGNVSEQAAGGAEARRFAYEPGCDRLAALEPPQGAAIAVSHDPDGAVAVLGAMRLTHDGPGGRASRVACRDEATRLAIHRDAAGERVLAIATGAGAARRLCLRSGRRLLVEIDGDGRREMHVEGLSRLVALVIDGQDHPVSTDLRRSVRAVWTGGRVAVQFDYRPFGGLDAGNSRLADPLAGRVRTRYAGQWFDAASGLYDDHARLYDPDLARFLSPDPAGQGASPYAYAGNDPVNVIDPTGATLERVVRVGNRYLLLDENDIVQFSIKTFKWEHRLATLYSVGYLAKARPYLIERLYHPDFIFPEGSRWTVKRERLADWIFKNLEVRDDLAFCDSNIRKLLSKKRIDYDFYDKVRIQIPIVANRERVLDRIATSPLTSSPATLAEDDVPTISNAPSDKSWEAIQKKLDSSSDKSAVKYADVDKSQWTEEDWANSFVLQGSEPAKPGEWWVKGPSGYWQAPSKRKAPPLLREPKRPFNLKPKPP